jgi:hypothetical protein
MIIDGKYHAASLIAVFLALGIGIIIGCLMVGETFIDNIVAQQEEIIERLEADYDTLKKEALGNRRQMEEVREESEHFKEYALSSLPYVLKDRLSGKRIAIIEKDLTPEFFLENLKLAGAEIVSVTSLGNNIAVMAENDITDLAAFFNLKPRTEDIPEMLAASLAEMIMTGGDQPYPEILRKLNISQKVKGTGAADTALFVVPPRNSRPAGEEDNIEAILARQLVGKGLKVFYAETGLLRTGELGSIECIPCQVKLIFSMVGTEYGIKK